MKKFFRVSQQPVWRQDNAQDLPPAAISSTSLAHALSSTLGPRYAVPPVPKPCPHRRIAVLATHRGLVLRPITAKHDRTLFGGDSPSSNVLLTWGKSIKLEELLNEEDTWVHELSWDRAAVIFGLLGTIVLNSS